VAAPIVPIKAYLQAKIVVGLKGGEYGFSRAPPGGTVNEFVRRNIKYYRLPQQPAHAKRLGLIIIIAVPVVPMTMVAPVPVPVPVRTIIVVVVAIVVRIVATVVYRIRVVIGRAHRYAKVTVSLGFLGHESDEPKRQQN
jgi:hypothetical protein